MAIVVDNRIKLTYAEYRLFPQDGRRHEIIDGDHYVNPAPDLYHQAISRRIQFQLYQQIEEPQLGEVINAPADLQLSETDIVQPDLMVVLRHRRQIMTPKKIKGPPDIVVEILSETTAQTDRELKKELYQRSGVPEYWVVDPDDHLVEQYRLVEGRYQLVQTCHDEIALAAPAGVSVDLTKVW
ncbi:MAG: Uma2 family endonuclease [Planctomycetota bacterium]